MKQNTINRSSQVLQVWSVWLKVCFHTFPSLFLANSDLLTSESMHDEGLLQTIHVYLPTLVLKAQAIFLSEHRHIDKQTDKIRDATKCPTHDCGYTASMGKKAIRDITLHLHMPSPFSICHIPIAYAWQTWHHLHNQKYIPYCTVIKEGPSDRQKQHALNIWWNSVMWFLTYTSRHTYRQMHTHTYHNTLHPYWGKVVMPDHDSVLAAAFSKFSIQVHPMPADPPPLPAPKGSFLK